eukprot:jgi/Hompol1/7033/HPOL_002968-RA
MNVAQLTEQPDVDELNDLEEVDEDDQHAGVHQNMLSHAGCLHGCSHGSTNNIGTTHSHGHSYDSTHNHHNHNHNHSHNQDDAMMDDSESDYGEDDDEYFSDAEPTGIDAQARNDVAAHGASTSHSTAPGGASSPSSSDVKKWSGDGIIENQSELRRRIVQIQQDTTLTSTEKARKIQELMSSGWTSKQKLQASRASLASNKLENRLSNFESVEDSDRVPSWHLTSYDQRIIDLLLSEDAALLEIVCQSSFVGETAAVVSKGVLTLLKYRCPEATEDFLKRIFRTRAIEYGMRMLVFLC